MKQNDGYSHPILVTGAAGEVGGIGRTTTELLLRAGFRVRALVRTLDERSEALEALGAEVVAADLLDLNAMHKAVAGVERMYFGMSVSAQYLEATANVAAVAKHHRIQAFVNMSQMTVSQMSIFETTPSPQQKLHWLAEQVLSWSGLPVVQIRPTVFLEGFFLRFAAADLKRKNELALPMGTGKTSPISSSDVAHVVATVLAAPQAHIGQIYNLTGPQSEDLSFYAKEYAAALGRSITYRNVDLQEWRAKLVKFELPKHLIDHVAAMALLNQDNRYDRLTDDVERLTGTAPMSLREFVRIHAKTFAA